MTRSTGVLEPLEGRSATIFLLAGGLLVVFAANTGLRAFAGGGYSAIHSVFGPGGFFLGLVGLFGLYPGLVGRTPILARATGAVAALPAIGWFVIVVFGIGSTAGLLPGMSVVFPPAFPILVFLTTILAYVLFGVASLRAGIHSQPVGIVLLLPAVPFLTLIGAVAVMSPVAWLEFAIDSGHALAHLTVWLALRSEGVSTDHGEPTAEATP